MALHDQAERPPPKEGRSLTCPLGVCALLALMGAHVFAEDGTWIGTWASSPVGLPTVERIGTYILPPPTTIKGTIRYRLRVSVGGRQLRLRFSNEYGEREVGLGAVTVGLAGERLDAEAGSLRRATFGGKEAITIPAGSIAVTDPIDLTVEALGDLVVSVYLPDGMTVQDWSSPFDPILIEGADSTRTEHLSASRTMSIRPLVSEVDVRVGQPQKVIVTLGDSITNGSVDPQTGDRGWPGTLARRLQSQRIAVVNAGISGNRLLQSIPMLGLSALSRLDRDVFSVPGLSHVILLEGINDIGMSGPGGMFGETPLVKSGDLLAAYCQIIRRVHERGIKILGGTILPFKGAEYYSVQKEQVRATLNAWIRTSNEFDRVVDFDAAVRDPSDPRKLKAEYDSGDHLHPSAAGYRQMGAAIDLRLFD